MGGRNIDRGGDGKPPQSGMKMKREEGDVERGGRSRERRGIKAPQTLSASPLVTSKSAVAIITDPSLPHPEQQTHPALTAY